MLTLENFIAGRHRPSISGGTIPVYEPATGELYAAVPDSTQTDVEHAVAAAHAAFPAWAATPAAERSRLLLRLADLIDANLDALARAESRDTGKPIALARAVDIPRSAANVRHFATAILHSSTQAHDFDGGGVPGGVPAFNYTKRTPRGVAACISPWNLPLYLLTWKLSPALATGNTVVAKPSEVTPVTAWMLSGLAADAGFPPGVLNIIHGSGLGAGAPLVNHPLVPAVTFTGSTPVGQWIGEACGRTLKRCSLELGGKNPFVIFEDADLDTPGGAIDTAARAAFTNQGQICLCGSRLLVHESMYQRVVAGLVDRARFLRAADPLDPATRFGAITSKAQFDKVSRMVHDAKASGGQILAGGRPVPASDLPERCRAGWFYEPTVIAGLDPACPAEQEEIFGPVVTVRPFKDEPHAAALANGTPYGLAATVFTRDVARAHRVAAAIDAGIVWVNCWMVRDLRTPFGGTRQSGIGREGGDEALRFFTEPKNICIGL